MGRLDLPDVRRDEDDVRPDREWTQITIEHRDELYRKADRVRALEKRVAELQEELRRSGQPRRRFLRRAA